MVNLFNFNTQNQGMSIDPSIKQKPVFNFQEFQKSSWNATQFKAKPSTSVKFMTRNDVASTDKIQPISKGIPQVKTPTQTSSPGLYTELEFDIKNGATEQEILEAYPEVKNNTQLVNELVFDIKNGATIDEIQQAYPELSENNIPKQTENKDLEWFDLWIKASEWIANIGKKLKFEAWNSLEKSKNPFAKSFWQLLEAVKFAWNIPWDTIEIVGELWQAISNPIWTAKSVKKLAEATIETWLNKITWADFYTTDEKRQMINWVSKALDDNFWSLEKIKKTVTENPADVLFAIQWWLQWAKLWIKDPVKLAQIDKINEAISPINILKTEWKLAWKVIWWVTSPLTSPAKAVIEQWKILLSKPNEIQGIQQAIKPYVKVKDGKVVRWNEQITNEIKRANELIKSSWDSPTDLATYRTSLEKQLKWLGEQISSKTKQPLEVDLSDTAWKLRELSSNKTVWLLDKWEAQKLMNLADDLEKRGKISVSDAEYMNQFINDTLRNIPNVSETYKRGLNILVKDLREKLDFTLSTIPWEFKQIKKDYWAVRNILSDTIKREIVYNRQNPEWLISWISKVEWLGNIWWWVLKILWLDVKWWVADIGKWLIQNKVWAFIKTKNDPNYIINQIFSNKWKNVNSTNTNILSTNKNNLWITKNLWWNEKIAPTLLKKSVLSDKEKALITKTKSK